MNEIIMKKIKEERKKAGFTQEKLAIALGTKTPTVAQWERGVRNPTVESLKRVSDVLCITVDKLLPDEWLSPERTANMSMTMNDYQQAAARTINPALQPEQVLHHALHGLASEVGELHGLFQKAFQGHELDPEHMKKELGDSLWMVAEFCTAMGWTLEDVARANLDKLKARYPDGFRAENSLHRKEGDV